MCTKQTVAVRLIGDTETFDWDVFHEVLTEGLDVEGTITSKKRKTETFHGFVGWDVVFTTFDGRELLIDLEIAAPTNSN